MAASICMYDDLLARLKQYAKANGVSASAVVRDALTRYLVGEQPSAFELGAALFGNTAPNDSQEPIVNARYCS